MLKTKGRILGIKISALVEVLVMIAVMLLVDSVYLNADIFADVNPHPFWLIVILISIQYGTVEGFISAIICTIVYVTGRPDSVINVEEQTTFFYQIGSLPILWLGMSVITGELMIRHIRQKKSLQEDVEELRVEVDTITDNYQKLRDKKQRLEQKLASNFRSGIDVFNAARKLEKYNSVELISSIEDLVVSLLDVEKFSIFVMNKNTLNAEVRYGWQEDDTLLKTISSDHPLFQAMVAEQKPLFVSNEEEEKLLSHQGVMAGPIMDANTGDCLGMIKIEAMPFIEYTISSQKKFTLICDWISEAFTTTKAFEKAITNDIQDHKTGILSFGYFQTQTGFLTQLAQRMKFNVSAVIIRIVHTEPISDAVKESAKAMVSDAIKSKLRSVDSIFQYKLKELEFAVVLPSANHENSELILQRIEAEINEKRTEEMQSLTFSYSISMLHEVEKE